MNKHHDARVAETPSSNPSSEISILLVDDLQDNLDVLEALLGRPDCRLLKASSGREALELLLQFDVALALLDVHMPGMDGFELAELMRGTERTRAVPIIFVTASTPAVDRVFRGYEAGAVDFLFKPINQHLLQSKVNVFVELFRQRQQLAAQVAEYKALVRTAELLIGVLSHDLRGPLGAVLAATDVLAGSHASDAAILHITGHIRSSSKRMARLIEQLLDFATARIGGLPVRPRTTDLELLCRTALAEFQVAAGRVHLQVSGDAMGTWDPDRLLQVLTNLIGNALQHGEPDRDITISILGDAPGHVTLRVVNRGTIPDVMRDGLFSPFVRPAESPTHGTGLGMYIVGQIARSHGGHASVQSADNVTAVEVRIQRHVEAGTAPMADGP